MIRKCNNGDFDAICRIVNDAAEAYRGVIPRDRWKEPYMPREELEHEIRDGVEFWGYEENSGLVGVMGIQEVKDVTLIRHAYVLTARRRGGVGSALLRRLLELTDRPVLIGTWEAAGWAVRFYEKHGFRATSREETEMLLRKYWKIPERQIHTSVVLRMEEKPARRLRNDR